MNVIYVTGAFPYPLTSGYLRHYHLLARLAEAHDIRLFSLVGADHSPTDREQVEGLGVEVHTFDVSSTPIRRFARRAGRLVPRTVAGGAAELRRAVAECVSSGWPDAAIVSGKTTTASLAPLAQLPLIVDACDATSMRLASQLSDVRGVRRVIGGLELRAMRSVEDRLHRRADRVLVASRRDGEHLGFGSNTAVVPNGVDTTFWSRVSSTRPSDTVIFTGKMSYAPNEDAAVRLAIEVWPVVRARRPGARLLIVGTDPRPRLVALGGRDGIEVTGRVEDMRQHLERATVFAAPIRYGAGIQNKLLEALAMALPVVASTNAADGLVVEGERPPVHVTDSLAEMAERIVDELEAADRDPAPIESNRDWVAARFDWDVSASKVNEMLTSLVGEPTSGGVG